MLSFLARRLLSTLPVLMVVAVLVFLMLRLTPGDPAAFHAALLMLADDPGLAERMGRDAFATARERFTPAAMAAGHEQLYAELLAARKR